MDSEAVIKIEVSGRFDSLAAFRGFAGPERGSSCRSRRSLGCSGGKEFVCKCVCFLLVSVPLPLCPGLSSSPTVCEFIHRKCRRASRVAGLMRSDVASPASRELSMSGRSARGKQTVDKIFNAALPVHGSNTSGIDPPPQKSNRTRPLSPPHLLKI